MNLFKKIPLLIVAALIFTLTSNSQVGINTTDPRTTLEVGGDMKISNNVEIGAIDQIADSDTSTFLNQNSGNEIKSFDVSNPTGTALGYIQQYLINDPDGDWVFNFNTGISATDFSVTIISAVFNKDVVIAASSISDNFSLPLGLVYSSGGTWRLYLDYPAAIVRDLSGTETWTVDVLIFSKDLAKQFPNIEVNMGNTNSATSSSPVVD